jgi:dihydroorotase
MTSEPEIYDLVLKGGRVVDPAQRMDGVADVAIRNGRVAAVAAKLPPHRAARTENVAGSVVVPGVIDMHVHNFQWVTGHALNADELGVHSGATTTVSMGDTGSLTLRGFKHYVAAQSKTHLLCVPTVMGAGFMNPTPDPHFFHPDTVDIDANIKLAREEPEIVRGFKAHGDEGCLSRFGTAVIEKARKICDETGLPLYLHTGLLVSIVEATRPGPKQVIDIILPWLKAGDILAHPFALYPDGLLTGRDEVPPQLRDALDRGVLLDLGRGHHLSIDIARKMMPKGIIPDIISSDVHGTFGKFNDATTLDYSLFGTLSLFLALGMTLNELIERVTVAPARWLRMQDRIGTLAPGAWGDVTVFDIVPGTWVFKDRLRASVTGKEKLVPKLVVRLGEVIRPEGSLLRDLEAA